MKVGDRVIVTDGEVYGGILKGHRGTITRKISYSDGKLGVDMDLMTNTASLYGIFWLIPGSMKVLKKLDDSDCPVEKNNIEEDYKMFGKYKAVGVRFLDAMENAPEYVYAAFGEFNVDDVVVVHTGHHGLQLAKITSVGNHMQSEVKGDREIVCKVVLDMFEERQRKAKKAAELKAKMDVVVKDLQANAIYELLAKEDKGLALMLEEYKGLVQ